MSSKVPWLGVFLLWLLALFLTFVIIQIYLIMLPEFISAPVIKVFFEGPEIYLLALLLIPSLRKLPYLLDYPKYLKENYVRLATHLKPVDDDFQKRFIRLSFMEMLIFPVIASILNVLIAGKPIFSAITPYLFYFTGEIVILSSYLALLSVYGYFAVPMLFYKLKKPKN